MLKFKVLTVFIMFFAISSVSYGSEIQREWIERGDNFFNQRGENNDGDWADTLPIENALSSYLKAYETGEPSEELIEKILKASYFYATYAEKDPARQKEILNRAIKIGEYGIKRYPNSVAINYQMSGCWGRWGEANGIIASARQGVAEKIRGFAEKVISLDPKYADGGGYRALGRLHFKAPYIPLILSWPDKKEALRLLSLAVGTGPENLTNHLFYAESLYHAGKIDKSLKEADIILDAELNPKKIVEDLRDKKEAERLKERISKESGK
ncbi:MAG: hypothetical protein HZC45_06740 [Deltaproteobacteria bacterium]|nr:hypothetical protein [Deltaproteobacteria bacterium]